MSKLDFLNRFILQWFFIRVARQYVPNSTLVILHVMYWVYPLSGYGKEFRYTKSGCRYLFNIYIY